MWYSWQSKHGEDLEMQERLAPFLKACVLDWFLRIVGRILQEVGRN